RGGSKSPARRLCSGSQERHLRRHAGRVPGSHPAGLPADAADPLAVRLQGQLEAGRTGFRSSKPDHRGAIRGHCGPVDQLLIWLRSPLRPFDRAPFPRDERTAAFFCLRKITAGARGRTPWNKNCHFLRRGRMDPFGETSQTSLDLLSHENTMDQQLELFAALAAPFLPEEVRVRSQGARQIQYITARTVMNRLDDVLGPANW